MVTFIVMVLTIGETGCVLCGDCGPPPATSYFDSTVAERPSLFSLDAFKALKIGMNENQVYSRAGLPTGHWGSGVAYDNYELADGFSVHVAWLQGRVGWILAYDKNGEEIYRLDGEP